MRAFVNRSGSPSQAQPQGHQRQQSSQGVDLPTRQQLAANAKVAAPRAKRPLRPNRQNQMPPPPTPGTFHAQENQPGPQRDRYDTDLESIGDTTTLSEVQIKDSQVDSQGRPYASYSPDMDEEEQGITRRDVAIISQRLAKQGEPAAASISNRAGAGFSFHQDHHGGDVFGGDQSYPTTTSGRLESRNGDDELGFVTDVEDDEAFKTHFAHLLHDSAPAAQSRPQQLATKPLQKPLLSLPGLIQKPPAFSMAPPPIPSRVTAAPLQQSRSDTNLAVRSGIPRIDIQRPHTVMPHQNAAQQQRVIVQQGNQAILIGNGNPNQPEHGGLKGSTNNALQAINGQAVQSQLQATEDAQGSEPVEDYSEEILFAKPYSALEAESFDYNPRGHPNVIPEVLAGATLAERMEYALHQLSSDSQAEFFGTLKIDEWEEGGEWILEQFTDIVKAFIDSRREKRKAATAFEKEVQERHSKVQNKKATIHEALTQMKANGQVVLKSPSKSRGQSAH